MVVRRDGNGWEVAGIGEELREVFSSWRRAITFRVAHLINQYTHKHGRKPSARPVWSMAQFVTLDSRQCKAHSARARAELLARWEAQSRRAEMQALSAMPGEALGSARPGPRGSGRDWRRGRPGSGGGDRGRGAVEGSVHAV
jgi:hypothetical protein